MKNVFLFTIKQNSESKGFKFATFVIPVILLIIGIVVSLFMAAGSDKKEDDSLAIEKLYITNDSSLEYDKFDYFGLVPCVTDSKVPENETKSADLTIADEEDGYSYTLTIPEWSELSEDDEYDIMPALDEYMNMLAKIDSFKKSNPENGTADEMLFAAFSPVSVFYETEGNEDVNFGAMLFKMIAPMLITLLLYMMALIYGQTISKTVISEKVSKLMETLLISVKPVELITGKILAMASLAILQMFLWITGLVSGFLLGHVIAKSVYGDYFNIVFEIIKMMKDSDGGLAFSGVSLVLSLLVLVIGFVFVCVFAGLISSPVSKAEELSSYFSIYQMFIVFGFLASYFLPLYGEVSKVVDIILHLIPFTAVFMLPSDIILGNISFAEGIIYVLVLTMITAFAAWYTGRLYKNQVFYNNSNEKPIKKLLDK